ncbi:conserved phage C-terminal domain-containing protein [Limosilactobacillus vaginalis]|uniref:conserved phage C-terminal domain-containing protein n=1 Tax=Limosilactobacillus vaginalis TaxID=1633 RepID=UPI0025A465C2|nr:conserved phage C-terminal domain-containing protein [Limosilactobacillus vaginalis]MDM8243608.1 conserved phage C-terminal domain-containing protein [Limosilactobacillus vaginalis]
MSKLLLDERPLQVQASLAKALGSLDQAVILQQLHYWLQRSNLVRENHRWVYNSMAEWNKQFPWMKRKTLSDKFKKLEKKGLIITGNYNKAAFDKTKWYRIDYDAFSHLEQRLSKKQPTIGKELPNGNGKNYPMEVEEFTQPIPLDYTETTQETTTKDNKGSAQPPHLSAQRKKVIDYLNKKTGKRFKPNADGNKRVIDPRLKDGYTVDDLKHIIDVKYAQWHGKTFSNGQLGDNYLRPETLFRVSKIEGYLNEEIPKHKSKEPTPDWFNKEKSKPVKKTDPRIQRGYVMPDDSMESIPK